MEENWSPMDEKLSEENIKHLIFREEPEELVFPMYHSKHSARIRKEVQGFKECHRTMGLPPELICTCPSAFLKKRTRLVRRPDVDKSRAVAVTKSKVPRHDELTPKTETPDTNYLFKNIRYVVKAVPGGRHNRITDSKTGHLVHDCVTEPKMVYHKYFGKVPAYLKDFKKNKEQEQKETEEMESLRKSTLHHISDAERDKLLNGLKKNWEEMQKEFQLLPMLNDTPPKIKRKAKLEKELNDLEKEIDLIERNKILYVYTKPASCEDQIHTLRSH